MHFGGIGRKFQELTRTHTMNSKPKPEKSVKLSVSMNPEHVAFIESNKALFKSVSAAVAQGMDEHNWHNHAPH